MPGKQLPSRPDLRHLKHQASDLLASHRAGSAEAVQRVRAFHPHFSATRLTRADALLTIAREYGFSSWPKLKLHIEGLERLERRVSTLRAAFAAGDGQTKRTLLKPAHDRRRFENYDPDAPELSDADARLLIANEEGYAFWAKYESYLHLDPSLQQVIIAVRTGDRNRLTEILREEPWAASPRWVPGFAPPGDAPNDSVPLFCVSEAVHRRTNTRGNEYSLVRDLVSAGADPDFQHGMPMVAAVSFNVPGAVEALLDSGAAIDGVDGDGTYLAYALHFGHSAVAQLLARRGARTDLRFDAGLGSIDKVKRWFRTDGSLEPGAGALVDPYAFEHKMRGQSPFRCERTRANILNQALYFGCRNGALDVAAFLLEQGAGINAIVPGLDSRSTILHQLALMDTGSWSGPPSLEDAIRFLLEHGADLTIRDEVYHATPLGWASHTGHEITATLLRSLGAVD